MSTLVGRDVREIMIERVLARMREDVALASSYEDLGPPPVRYYLREHGVVLVPPTAESRRVDLFRATSKEIETAMAAARASVDRWLTILNGASLESIWEIAAGTVREVAPWDWGAVRSGAVRSAYFENAIVDFWIDVVRGEVTAQWELGPRRHGYQLLALARTNGRTCLDTLRSNLSRL